MSKKSAEFPREVISEILDISQSHLLKSRRVEGVMSPLDKRALRRQDLWQLNPSKRHTSNEYQNEQERIRQIVKRISEENAGMLSEDLIIRKVLYDVIAPRLWDEISEEEAAVRATTNITALVSYRAKRLVDLPIMHLMLKPKVNAVPFGLVTFKKLMNASTAETWFKDISTSKQNRIFVFGQVEVPGDLEMAARNASKVVRDALLLLRGIGFPIQNDNVEQIGLINEVRDSIISPHRCHLPQQTARLEYESPTVSLIDATYNIISVEDLIEKSDSTLLPTLLNTFNRRFHKGTSSLGEIERKIIECFDWIGEATKSDSNSAKFLKLSVAFELLVGGDANDDPYLTTRGINATLAERVAFLLGSTTEERLAQDKKSKQLYGLRSKLVHGSNTIITENDLVDFADLIRRSAWALLGKLHEIDTVNKLAKWVFEQRYTMEVTGK